MSRRPRTTIEPGIYQEADGSYVVCPRLGSKRTIELQSAPIRFPAGTEIGILRAEHLKRLATLQDERNAWKKTNRPARGTLAADVEDYFATATLTANCEQIRRSQFAWWIAKFPNRSRHTLEAGEIQRALKTLEATRAGFNKKTADGAPVARQYRPASASTKNHYRTALSHLYTVLNGKNGSNPVKDVPKYNEGTPEAHDLPYDVIEVILAHVRDRGQGDHPSLSKARLAVLAHAPITPAQLWRLPRFDYARGTMIVPGRRKGAGTLPQAKDLTPAAIAAFRLFDAAEAWEKRASASSLHQAFNRGKAKAIAELRQTRPDLDFSRIERARPYHLRHSFGTLVYATTGDLNMVQELLDHADARTTRRYAQGAVSARIQVATAAIAAALASRPAYVPPAPVAAPAPRPRLVKR